MIRLARLETAAPRSESVLKAPQGRRRNLDALTGTRFIAAVWVAIYHAAVWDDWMGYAIQRAPSLVRQFVAEGYIAVSFFFVLSGFILAYSYFNEDVAVDRPQFWRARFARIYPVYLLGLVLYALVASFGAVRPISALGAFTSTVLLMQAWVPFWIFWWNLPGWSLSAEAFFYFIFPFAIHRIARLNDVRRACAYLLVPSILLAAIVTLSNVDGVFSMNALSTTPSRPLLFFRFAPIFRLPEFLIGVACGIHFLRHGSRINAIVPLIIIATLLLLGPWLPLILFNQVLFAVPFAMLCLALAHNSGLLASRVMIMLGESSYAFYILHIPVAYGLQRLWKTGSGLRTTVYWLTMLILSRIAYLVIEEPCRRYLRSRNPARPAN